MSCMNMVKFTLVTCALVLGYESILIENSLDSANTCVCVYYELKRQTIIATKQTSTTTLLINLPQLTIP